MPLHCGPWADKFIFASTINIKTWWHTMQYKGKKKRTLDHSFASQAKICQKELQSKEETARSGLSLGWRRFCFLLRSCSKSALLPWPMAYLFCSPPSLSARKRKVRTRHTTQVRSAWVLWWIGHFPTWTAVQRGRWMERGMESVQQRLWRLT